MVQKGIEFPDLITAKFYGLNPGDSYVLPILTNTLRRMGYEKEY
jgi:hypothetical protein